MDSILYGFLIGGISGFCALVILKAIIKWKKKNQKKNQK